jgi:probable selenium-dependent hydroxylase accessory protein YqeC
MDLWGALQLDWKTHRAVALVGGGGKTSAMYTLARQARDGGRTVIVTTTTHIMPHPHLPLTDDPDPAVLKALLERHGVITLGRFLRPDKLSGVEDMAVCRQVADVVVIEADGARLRPLKAPAEHEPVIPPWADAVVAVAGMDSVGRSVAEICHRPEQVCALLGCGMEHRITPGDVAAILAHPQGGRKGVEPHMAFRCLLNKADTGARLEFAREIAHILTSMGMKSAITRFTDRERGGTCLF